MESLSWEFADADQAVEFFSAGYGRCRMDLARPSCVTKVSRTVVGALTVDEVDVGGDLSYRLAETSGVNIALVRRGTVTTREHGSSLDERFVVSDIAVRAPGHQPDEGTIHRASFLAVTLDSQALQHELVIGARSEGQRALFSSHRPYSPGARNMLTSVLLHLRDSVISNPTARQSPLVLASAAQHLAATVLAAVPNSTHHVEPALADTRDANTRTLRLAITFIEDNAHRGITTADIAGVARVTPRALQYAFKRHAQTTPLAYLRQVRLARAHAELEAATADTRLSVGEVASRWGFAHHGRFATAYRNAYGAPPSVTLRQPPVPGRQIRRLGMPAH
ncbi:helix-turn-helix transcriptional regulator [Streptomyces sp. NPDC047023]|uniref:helix-turn-helix transcriptional regulator n=1 Tax=Streptomyces sp. NPDC047023 TaxID=3155139 RepID=UPI003406F8EA